MERVELSDLEEGKEERRVKNEGMDERTNEFKIS